MRVLSDLVRLEVPWMPHRTVRRPRRLPAEPDAFSMAAGEVLRGAGIRDDERHAYHKRSNPARSFAFVLVPYGEAAVIACPPMSSVGQSNDRRAFDWRRREIHDRELPPEI